ncbi:hypothetical protein BDZ45DRAFT_699479 [Acephala macrosclerotiorum]|nr:hypothetical protein BDZ45DRAFT_699479 [Acephala macrosclerotiorum]
MDIGSLDILGFCNDSGQAGVPSWCPDWTSLGSTANRLLCRFFDAGKGTTPVVSTSDGVLTINGVVLDEIEALWGPPPQTWSHATFIRESLMELEAFVARTCSQESSMDEKTRQAFRRTIVADLKWDPHDMKHITNLDEAYEAWAVYVALPDLETIDGRVLSFQRAVDLAFIGHQFAVTKSGIFALVSRKARVGDSLAVFQGGDVPYCISKGPKGAKSEGREGRKDTNARYTFLGEW